MAKATKNERARKPPLVPIAQQLGKLATGLKNADPTLHSPTSLEHYLQATNYVDPLARGTRGYAGISAGNRLPEFHVFTGDSDEPTRAERFSAMIENRPTGATTTGVQKCLILHRLVSSTVEGGSQEQTAVLPIDEDDGLVKGSAKDGTLQIWQAEPGPDTSADYSGKMDLSRAATILSELTEVFAGYLERAEAESLASFYPS